MAAKSEENIHYVYKHIDPRTGEVVYVGNGCRSRAWQFGTWKNNPKNKPWQGHRKPEHHAWFLDLEKDGFHLGQIVVIEQTLLSPADSRILERKLIEQYKPKFNITGVRPPTHSTQFIAELKTRMNGNTLAKGTKWWTDGRTDKRDIVCPGIGWILGRTNGPKVIKGISGFQKNKKEQ